MKKTNYYTYLGTNGTITSPVFLENIYSVKKVLLTAEQDKTLTKDFTNFHDSIMVSESEVENWYEISL